MTVMQDMIDLFGNLSSIPANWIDEVELHQPNSFWERVVYEIKKRAIFLFVFVPLLPVDVACSALGALGSFIASLFTSDKNQMKHMNNLQFYATSFSKHLYGLLAWPIGLFIPYSFTFLFVNQRPKSTGVTSGDGSTHAEHVELAAPETLDALQALIRDANLSGKKVIAIGAGRSQGKQYLPEQDTPTIVIDMKNFNQIEINATEKTATVGAGVLWRDLQHAANEHRLALKVMQASNIFSVGGSVSSNVHGWDYHTGVLSNSIRSITILNADGQMVEVTPADPLFHQITGGLGLFGVVVRVTLNLADNEYLKRTSVSVDPANYHDYFNSNLRDKPNNRLHLYRLSLDPKNLLRRGFTETYVVPDEDEPHGQVKTPDLDFEAENGTRTQRILVSLARRIDSVRHLYWNYEKDDFAKNNPISTTNAIMQAPINAMFNTSVSEAEWLQEYFVPGDQLHAFLDSLGTLLMDNHVKLMNATVRFVKQHDASPLSYASNCDRFAVVLCFNQSLKPVEIIKTKKWLRTAQHLSVSHGGSYYLPYQHVSSTDDFNAAYPHARDAKAFKDKVDPNGIFCNGFHDKYLAQPDTHHHVKDSLANAATREAFKGFLSGVLKRVDAEKIYKLLDDILTYTDTHAELYQELCQRLPEIMPSILADLYNKLSSLAAIKHDIGEQAYSLLPADMTTINGIVEVGSPGRYINEYRKHYHVTGDIVAVNDSQSIGDYIDAGSTHPYDKFIPLNYDTLDLSSLPDNSADLVTCYVGLHHFPTAEKLEQFLLDTRRVLRDNGRFLLIDHDVKNEATNSMAHLAHIIFNAVNGVSLHDEMAEYRDFKSIEHWSKLLARHGLGDATEGPGVAMIREGDPTRNRMITLKKIKPVVDTVIDEPPVVIPRSKSSQFNCCFADNIYTLFGGKHSKKPIAATEKNTNDVTDVIYGRVHVRF